MKAFLLIGAFLTGGIIACSPDARSPENPAPVTTVDKPDSSALPSFKMMGLDGRVVNLADFKGKKVFVNLWATWCPPCRAEIPSIENLYSKANKNNSVFVMLSLDNDFSLAKEFARKEGLKLPVYYPAEPLPALFETPGIPVTFIFNEKGQIVKNNNGMDDYDTGEYQAIFR